LIVSAVKICKQCLQTNASAPTVTLPLDPHWRTSVPHILGYAPTITIITGAITSGKRVECRKTDRKKR